MLSSGFERYLSILHKLEKIPRNPKYLTIEKKAEENENQDGNGICSASTLGDPSQRWGSGAFHRQFLTELSFFTHPGENENLDITRGLLGKRSKRAISSMRALEHPRTANFIDRVVFTHPETTKTRM